MLIDDIYLQVFELKVQAALELFNLSANGLIFSAVSKRISQVNVVYHCGKGDQMAPPSGLPPPLKSWTKLFTLILFVLTFLFVFITTKQKQKQPLHKECSGCFGYFIIPYPSFIIKMRLTWLSMISLLSSPLSYAALRSLYAVS